MFAYGVVAHKFGTVFESDGSFAVGVQIVGVLRIQRDRHADLPEIGNADGLTCLAAHGEKNRQQDRRQQGNDADHNEQLDQSECLESIGLGGLQPFHGSRYEEGAVTVPLFMLYFEQKKRVCPRQTRFDFYSRRSVQR